MPSSPQSSGKIWRVGTLTYTRGGLANVFLWMLWGDFCLNLMDSGVIPNVVPIQMKKLGASNFLIGLVTGTVMEVMAVAMVAVISTWSDRHRGPLGRRMPFILWSTPPLALFLVLMGYSPGLAGYIKHVMPGAVEGISVGSLTIGMLAVWMVGYKFFDNFPQSIYYYLWPDVIPAELMGTFACLFRVVATGGVLLFNLYLLKYSEDRPEVLCLLAAGLYLFSFLMLVFMVKEPEYPPPEPKPPGKVVERSWRSVLRYIRECYFTHPGFYWKIYLFNVLFICGYYPFRTFLLFYARDDMHLSLATFGKIMAVRDVVQMAVFLSLGPIVDRLHPLRAGIIANVFAFLATAAGFLLTRGQTSFVIFAVTIYASVAIFQAATAALGPRILPSKQYGQFCSANAVVFHIGLMVAMPGSGWVFDRIGYRYTYAWFAVATFLSSVLILMLYGDWKRLGGDTNYQAPLAEEDAVLLV